MDGVTNERPGSTRSTPRDPAASAAYDDPAFGYDPGESALDLLRIEPGDRVLDLGCGIGRLTSEIAAAGATVVGIDGSPAMIDRARAAYPDLQFEVADAREFAIDRPFDAVFSNAVLHRIADQDAVTERVAEALGPEGRFVAEFGGQGNLDAVVSAVRAELDARGHDSAVPWYFPSVGEHARVLERHDFELLYARLFDRPTDLDGGADGLRRWLDLFADDLLAPLSADERDAVLTAVEDRLREDMFDPARETWTVDYRRLRFVAQRLS